MKISRRKSKAEWYFTSQERREFQGHIIYLSVLQMFKEMYQKIKEVLVLFQKRSLAAWWGCKAGLQGKKE